MDSQCLCSFVVAGAVVCEALSLLRRSSQRALIALLCLCRDVEAAKCVICLTNPREVLLRPCKHVVMCKDCASTRSRAGVPRVQQCPICRSPILSRERIFM